MGTRDELLAVARAWGEVLTRRPGVVGVFLYGSLAGDPAELTSFSDVDVALVLDDAALPEHFAEHRLWQGTKTDTTLLAASTLRAWLGTSPTGLFDGHWTNSLFLRALTQAGAEIILYDPTGLLTETQQVLPGYAALVAPDVRRWLAEYRTARLEKAAQEPPKIAELLHPGWLSSVVEYAAARKRLPDAAAHLGLPELIPLVDRWRTLFMSPPALLEPLCLARESLGQLATTAFYERLTLPGTQEIRGTWPVFWPGNRVHTIERLCAELPQTLLRSRQHRAQGDLYGANRILWPCDPKDMRERVQALCEAVAPVGYDISDLTKAFLTSPELAECEAAIATEAHRCALSLSDEASQEVLALARRALEILERRFGA